MTQFNLKLEWVENDPLYVDGFTYAKLPSGVRLVKICPVRVGIFRTKIRWRVDTAFTIYTEDGESYILGGYYDTLEQAKEEGIKMINDVFKDDIEGDK